MQINNDVINEIACVDKRFTRLAQVFAGFVERARYLVQEKSPFKALKLEVSADGNCLDAIFAGIRVRFQLLPGYGEDRSVRGRVMCSRQIPGLYKDSDILGSFTFLGNANTDFEAEPGHDPIELEYDADKIVLYFVDLAIDKPLPCQGT
jgi:hypothetical protein